MARTRSIGSECPSRKVPLRLSPALLVAALIWERRRRVVRAASWLLGALVAGHMLYWAVLFIGYGARYWYAAVPAVLVASLLGLRRLLLPDGGAPRLGAVAVAAILLLLVGWDLAAYWPARWSELPRYGGTTAGLRDEVERRNLDDAVIFVWTEDLIYYEGFGENDPFLRHGPFFVRDLGPRNAELIAAMPFDAPFRWTRGERLEPLVPPAMARHRPTPPRSGR